MRALDRALAMLALGRDGKFLSFQNDELDALSSLAAEIGRMAAVVEAATMLRHSGYDSRTMLFAVMCEAVDRYAALSSPAPEGTENG